ncbi:MAG: hypothetical protein HPZ91_00820 [Lentisphaeria bacterium]|nr:hypothetical protein [Lentisphaeria bacterium]
MSAMKKLSAGITAVLLATAAGSAGKFFSLQPDGALRAGEVTFRIIHRDANWSPTEQSERSVSFSGENAVTNERGEQVRMGSFSVRGGVFSYTEAVRLDGDEAELDLRLSSTSGIESKGLDLAVSLPIAARQERGIFFNGKNEAFGREFDDSDYMRNLQLKLPAENKVRIPLRSGTLTVSGPFAAMLQDNRKFGSGVWELRLRFRPGGGMLRKASFLCRMQFVPYAEKMLDLRAAANMGFRDEVAGDEQGGWSDQGPDNDLRPMPVGRQRLAGVSFDVVDPGSNGGRSVIVLSRSRGSFPDEALVPAGGERAKHLILLNAAAWPPAPGGEIGRVTVEYADGAAESHILRNGSESGNFWSPQPLPEAAVAWSGRNESSPVGLYATRFRLKGKPVRRIRFRGTGSAVWMIVGATLTDADIEPRKTESLEFQENALWRPIAPPRDVQRGSIIDFSGLLDAPAGKYGFLKSSGGRLEFEKRPGERVRFWGTNVCWGTNFMKKQFVDRMCDDLAAMGYNLLRLHHFDMMLADRKGNVSTRLDPERLDRLDYLAAECRKRGIYLTIDLCSLRTPEPGEVPGFDRKLPIHEYKALLFLNEGLQRNFETFAASLLDHVNPYTGIAWKDDPALVLINLVNENTIFHLAGRSESVKHEFERARGKAETEAPSDSFLAAVHGRWFDRTSAFLRKRGVRALLSDQNFVSEIPLTLLRERCDVVDNHSYWGHPQFSGKGRATVSASSSIGFGAQGIAAMFPTRIFGKPFAVTEWDYVNPNPYAVEGAFLNGAYAALQDYGMLCRFAYSHPESRVEADASPMKFYDVAADPLRSLSERAGALFFLRGDVAVSEVSYPLLMNPRRCFDAEYPRFFPQVIQRLGLIGRTGTVFDARAVPADARSLLTLPGDKTTESPLPQTACASVAETLKQMRARNIPGLRGADLENAVFKSSTGELLLMQKQNAFQAVTPRSEGFLLPPGGELRGSFATVRSRGGACAVLIAARDGKALADSSRILLLHLTETKNTAMRFSSPEMTQIEEWGTLPLLMRRNAAEITLGLNAPARLYACDFDGRRKSELPLGDAGHGRYGFIADNFTQDGAVAVYELVKGE